MLVSLRLAEPSDGEFLWSLAPRLAGVPGPHWHDHDAMIAFQNRFMDDAFARREAAVLTVIAESEARTPLGYVHAHASRDGVTNEPCGHVAILAVLAEAEGQGVARLLMERVEHWCRESGYRLLSLDVFAANRRAVDFYASGGYQQESIRMVKSLA